MSAIAGIFDLPKPEEVIRKLLASMHRRGPKMQESYESKTGCLLQTGQKLTELDWAGEHYILSMDGTLYNGGELRAQLLALGHSFQEGTDTELLLHGYAQWREGVLDQLNGVFAFAVYEEKSRSLFLARDRIGVKPLFYTEYGGGLVFGSEIKTVLAYPTVEAELDAQGAGELLLLGPGRTPGSGVFRNIRELEPGCCGVYQQGRLKLRRYWKLTDREHTDSFERTAEMVRHLLLDAIKRQMVTDVPMGAFLSGGLDSSLVSAVCAAELTKSGRRLSTFSVDYVDNDKYFRPGKFQPNSDPEFIRIMQREIGSAHRWTVLAPEQLTDALNEAVIARDLPGMADVDSSLLLFCGSVKPHAQVAMSGECADEIFGGYPWYRDPAVRDAEGFPWARNIRERTALLQPWITDALDAESFVQDRYRQTLVESDILPWNNPEETRMKQMVNLNFRWFMQTLLDRGDRMGMYQGLAVRVPFCDYRIAEYLYRVPWEFKDYQGREKGLLRYAMQDLLPEAVLTRKKSPYPKTHHPEYARLVTAQLEALLQHRDAPLLQLVSRQALQGLLQQDFALPWYGQLMRRPQIIGYMLQINFWLEHYSVRIV